MMALVALLMVPVSILIRGLVLLKLWEWFFVTTFAAPALSVPAALGIALVVSFLTQQVSFKKDDRRDEDLAVICAVSVLHPLVFLAFGFLYKSFM